MLPEHFARIGKSLMDVDACAFDRTGDDDRRDDDGGEVGGLNTLGLALLWSGVIHGFHSL